MTADFCFLLPTIFAEEITDGEKPRNNHDFRRFLSSATKNDDFQNSRMFFRICQKSAEFSVYTILANAKERLCLPVGDSCFFLFISNPFFLREAPSGASSFLLSADPVKKSSSAERLILGFAFAFFENRFFQTPKIYFSGNFFSLSVPKLDKQVVLC